MARIISSLIASLLLAGCVTPPAYVVPALPLPPEPVLPVVAQHEFTKVREENGAPVYEITRDVYERLVIRDALRRRYADELRKVITTHNEGAP